MRALAILIVTRGLVAAPAFGLSPMVTRGTGADGRPQIADRVRTEPNHAASSASLESHPKHGQGGADFADEFYTANCTFASTGRSPFYMPMQLGERRDLKGKQGGESIHVRLTVLDEAKVVNGVETRVLEEYETVDGAVAEVARKYVAFCTQTGSIFCFGEDIDIYEDGEIVGHEGACLAGENGAKPGLLMPGAVLLASRYYQELAPRVALDQAEHVSVDETVVTPAGTFHTCLEVRETTPLDPGETNYKLYARGIGLVKDGDIGFVSITPTAQR